MYRICGTLKYPPALCLFVFLLAQTWEVDGALAQEVDSCSAVTSELKGVQRALEQARAELAQAAGTAAELVIVRQALNTIEQELVRVRTDQLTCEQRHEALCQGARTFTRGLSIGRVDPSGVAACIDPSDRRAIVEQLAGWTNVSKALARLDAYSSGESDVPPQLGPQSGARVEAIMVQILGSGGATPTVFRRLIIEALLLLAPEAWAMRQRQPGQVMRFFTDRGELPDDIRTEVTAAASTGRADSGDSSLTVALELLRAYQLLGRCDGATAATDCRRAAQLATLVQTSGPLVAMRRVGNIWNAECESLNSEVLSSWTSDFPGLSADDQEFQSVLSAVQSKLVTCFLRDPGASHSFGSWVSKKLSPMELTAAEERQTLSALTEGFGAGTPGHRCVQAVRALQRMSPPVHCSASPEFISTVGAWTDDMEQGTAFALSVCHRYARALFRGQTVTLATSFERPPGVEEALRVVEDAPPSSMSYLREQCTARASGADFVRSVTGLAAIAAKQGENPKSEPWLVDLELGVPLEDVRVRERAQEPWQFVEAWWTPQLACSFLELDRERCEECRRTQDEDHYDCRKFLEVDRRFKKSTRSVLGTLGFALLGALGALWFVRLRRAKRTSGAWAEGARRHLLALGLVPGTQYSKWVVPSRFSWFKVSVPSQRGWERWGKYAIVLKPKEAGVLDRDVNLAGALAVRSGANLAFLVHEDTSAPDLTAVRAALEWSAREGRKAVHVLMLSWSRFTWAKNSQDLLDMTVSASLRTNPFELRGRVTSSAQFFNRERLVSGLLGGVQAGRFHVITGLRRSGKSSLALEVARRLPGPSAYVDLAGFHQEIQADTGPGQAADAILRYTCGQLLESARRFKQTPASLEVPSAELDALTLSNWFRAFFDELREQQDTDSTAVLLVFDEIEQGIGAARDLPHALDVLAILLGRLRNALQGTSLGSADRVGVLFASALHPLLWSPLTTLAGQSIVGSFEHVFVPCLPREATLSMMQGLGAWHGIRFTEEAASLVVDESQGVPLLARRLGTAVLELYDSDRARQGTLGAVNIGVEAVRAAVEREVTEGSPARVWIESEIAHRKSPGGAVLRHLAQRDWVPAKDLRRIAARLFQQEFVQTGIAAALDEHEVLRRSEEAGGVTVRMLGESGLLSSSGDPTEPDTYRLPEGMLRTVLGSTAPESAVLGSAAPEIAAPGSSTPESD